MHRHQTRPVRRAILAAMDEKISQLIDNTHHHRYPTSNLTSSLVAAKQILHTFISTQDRRGDWHFPQSKSRSKIVSFFSSSAAPFITKNRHRALLTEALNHLSRACLELPLELKCEELRRSALAIGKITGKKYRWMMY